MKWKVFVVTMTLMCFYITQSGAQYCNKINKYSNENNIKLLQSIYEYNSVTLIYTNFINYASNNILGTHAVDVSHLGRGVYIVEVRAGNKLFHSNLIK